MKEFRGLMLPQGLMVGMRACVDAYNRGADNWCARGCGRIPCSHCICCCNNFYDEHSASTKIQTFGDFARAAGYTVTRHDYNPDEGNVPVGICKCCGVEMTEATELCEDCRQLFVNGNIRICDDCGVYTSDWRVTEDTNDTICRGCRLSLHLCGDCGGWFRNQENVHEDSCSTVCNDCYDHNWYTCNDCGLLVYCDDVRTDDDGCYCEDCYNQRCRGLINDYCYKPDPEFLSMPDEDDPIVYLGIELEMGDAECSRDRDNAARWVDDNCPFAYLKRDGSIPGWGFELVTHPMSLAYHKDSNWDVALDKMRHYGLRSHDASESCGLHVHVDRNSLTPNQWVIVDWFIHREQERWEKIARRNEEHYASFKDKPENESIKNFYGKGYDRYTAVNFCNRHTVEFRLFRGTLRYSTFIGTLELVDALIKWAKTVHTHDILCSGAWGSFVQIVKSDEKYAEAVAYLNHLNLI